MCLVFSKLSDTLPRKPESLGGPKGGAPCQQSTERNTLSWAVTTQWPGHGPTALSLVLESRVQRRQLPSGHFMQSRLKHRALEAGQPGSTTATGSLLSSFPSSVKEEWCRPQGSSWSFSETVHVKQLPCCLVNHGYQKILTALVLARVRTKMKTVEGPAVCLGRSHLLITSCRQTHHAVDIASREILCFTLRILPSSVDHYLCALHSKKYLI